MLDKSDIDKIICQAVHQARLTESALRKYFGQSTNVKMHIAIIRLGESSATVYYSMDDAWFGSIDIAKRKAFTAMAFSSNENALTTRSIGVLSQPGQPLWHIGNSNPCGGIIEFPGGVPLYNKCGKLVGAIGVSGDVVDNDELVARVGAHGYEAPIEIRSDTVANIPFYKQQEKLDKQQVVLKIDQVDIIGIKQLHDKADQLKDKWINLSLAGDRSITNMMPFGIWAKNIISLNGLREFFYYACLYIMH